MKNIFSSILISTVLAASAASAADVTIVRNIENSKFEFTGTAEGSSCVTVDVYAPGKDFQDLSNDENLPFDIIKYHNEFYADEKGNFSFNVQLAGESGVYKTYLMADGEVKSINLEYVNKTANDEALAGLKTASDIKEYINTDTNRSKLGFFFELYDEVNQGSVAKLMNAKISKVAEPQEAIDIFEEAVIAQAITEGKISYVSDYKDRIAILNDGGKYEKRYAAIDEGAVDARINGKKFTSLDDFELSLAEAIVLETIREPNGYENVSNIMDEFRKEIGIETLTPVVSVYQKLAGNNYASFAELKRAYNDAEGSNSANTSTSGGSSGGGGRGGSSGSKVVSTGNGQPFMPEVNPTPLEKEYFKDMGNAEWAKTAVWYLAEKNIVSGKADGEFCPSDTVLREEFVTMIAKAFDIKKYVDENEFEDVSKDDWYYDYVLAANQNSIVSGVEEKLFGAGEKITRQDMAVILYRIVNERNIELTKEEKKVFADEAEISDYAKEAVSFLQQCGIISGMEDNTFAPKATATRAQAAQMIYVILTAI